MVKMKSILKDVGSNPTDVFEIQYGKSGLLIRVDPDLTGRAVHFGDPIGFRVLDEGDLLEFWEDGEYDSNGWIFRIVSGGWLDFERSRKGFFSSSDREDITEYLVATASDCVNILSMSDPRIIR